MIVLEGEFRKHHYFHNIFWLIGGLALIGFFAFADLTTNQTTTGIILGTIISGISIIRLTFNFNAYLLVTSGRIKGKFHWIGKINCNVSDVVFVESRLTFLTVELKNGKVYTISGLENAQMLASEIKRNLSFEVPEQPEDLIKKLKRFESARKRKAVYAILCLALMFINVFLTMYLTACRDIGEFSKIDWTIFSVMGVIEIALLFVTFYFAEKSGQNLTPIKRLKYQISRKTIETKALLPGNVISVFAVENYTSRITLFGFPNDDSIYYIIEKIAPDYTLVKVYDSRVLENIDEFSERVEELIDITSRVIH